MCTTITIRHEAIANIDDQREQANAPGRMHGGMKTDWSP